MEETKLDKAVDKLFRYVERVLNKFINAAKNLISFCMSFLTFLSFSYLIVFPILIVSDIYSKGWHSIITFNWIIFGYICYRTYLSSRNLIASLDTKLLQISSKFYAQKVVNDCFKPIIADWREEYFRAVNQNLKWQAFLINFRYTYAFLAAMIQQFSLRRLFEFFRFFTK